MLSSPEPDLNEARNALCMLLKSIPEDEVAFCFLIDGLDECHGGSNAHATLIEDLAGDFLRHGRRKNVKLIISSRPQPPFGTIYSKLPKITMQDLTQDDIRRYVNDKLMEANQNDSLSSTDVKKIVHKILRKHDGVFLWTAIVVTTVVSSMVHSRPYEDISKQVKDMPLEINDLIKHIIKSVPEAVAQTCRDMLSLFYMFESLNSPRHIHIEATALALTCAQSRMADSETATKKSGDLRIPPFRSIASQTYGLLELHENGDHDFVIDKHQNCAVRYMHRTVAEWVRANLMYSRPDGFDIRPDGFDVGRKYIRAICDGLLDEIALMIQRSQWADQTKQVPWFQQRVKAYIAIVL